MSKCNSCKYRAASSNCWTCEYITIVGHSRGCEPGDLCTVYERGDRIQLLNTVNYASDVTDVNIKSIEYYLSKFDHFN